MLPDHGYLVCARVVYNWFVELFEIEFRILKKKKLYNKCNNLKLNNEDIT